MMVDDTTPTPNSPLLNHALSISPEPKRAHGKAPSEDHDTRRTPHRQVSLVPDRLVAPLGRHIPAASAIATGQSTGMEARMIPTRTAGAHGPLAGSSVPLTYCSSRQSCALACLRLDVELTVLLLLL